MASTIQEHQRCTQYPVTTSSIRKVDALSVRGDYVTLECKCSFAFLISVINFNIKCKYYTVKIFISFSKTWKPLTCLSSLTVILICLFSCRLLINCRFISLQSQKILFVFGISHKCWSEFDLQSPECKIWVPKILLFLNCSCLSMQFSRDFSVSHCFLPVVEELFYGLLFSVSP